MHKSQLLKKLYVMKMIPALYPKEQVGTLYLNSGRSQTSGVLAGAGVGGPQQGFFRGVNL